jgi:hypothetical protein
VCSSGAIELAGLPVDLSTAPIVAGALLPRNRLRCYPCAFCICRAQGLHLTPMLRSSNGPMLAGGQDSSVESEDGGRRPVRLAQVVLIGCQSAHAILLGKGKMQILVAGHLA